jgi:hypothetical protein
LLQGGVYVRRQQAIAWVFVVGLYFTSEKLNRAAGAHRVNLVMFTATFMIVLLITRWYALHSLAGANPRQLIDAALKSVERTKDNCRRNKTWE